MKKKTSFNFINRQKRILFLKEFAPFEIKKNVNYTYFVKKQNGIIINVYQKKLLFQGKIENIFNWIQKNQYIYDFVYQNHSSKTTKKIPIKNKTSYIGFDEAGLSDFFGPIVISSFLVNEESIKILKNLNVLDSKKISSENIFALGKKLMTFKDFIAYKIISPFEFNNLKKKYHQKQLLAYFYGKMGEEWHQKFQNNNYCLKIDQFVTINSWKRYHQTLKIPFPSKIDLIIKGEDKYLGIAAASIISRYLFLKEIRKIELKFKIQIILGASKNAQNQAKNLIKKYTKKVMCNYLLNYLSLLDKR